MLVLGGVAQGIGGTGLGAAVRVQHQQTDRTTLGLELAGGRGEGDNTKLSMVALRGYGRTTVGDRDWLAVTYGAGISVLSTGMVSVGAHAGTAVSYPNDHFVPYLAVGVAVVTPIVEGDSFGDMEQDIDRPQDALRGPTIAPHGSGTRRGVRTNAYLTFDPGFVVPLGDTGHALSLDVGLAVGARRGTGFASLSLADRVHR